MTKRGAKPKPTAMLRLQGTTNATRHAARKEEPVPNGSLFDVEPPDHFDDVQRRLWHDVLSTTPQGMLSAADAHTFGIYIEAVGRHHDAVRAQNAMNLAAEYPYLVQGKSGLQVSPYVRVLNNSALIVLRAAAELGLTPASRPNLVARRPAKSDAADPWSTFEVIPGGKRA